MLNFSLGDNGRASNRGDLPFVSLLPSFFTPFPLSLSLSEVTHSLKCS